MSPVPALCTQTADKYHRIGLRSSEDMIITQKYVRLDRVYR